MQGRGDYAPTADMIGACALIAGGRLTFAALQVEWPITAWRLRSAGLVARDGALTVAGEDAAEAVRLSATLDAVGRRWAEPPQAYRVGQTETWTSRNWRVSP